MSDVAALVAPSLRWHPEYGYSLAERDAHAARAFGCRAFLLHGGPLGESARLVAALRERAPHPLLVAAELGGGVGERFAGATALPPLAAFDTGDLAAVRRAARLTAREARGAGINQAVAPSCVDPRFASPIAVSRTFVGGDDAVADACAEWLDGCRAEGVLATPGPYPLMRAAVAGAVLDAGVGAVLLSSAHSTDAATVRWLRNQAGFDGLIAAPIGAAADERHEDEEPLAVAAIAAGCDLLLGVDDTPAVVRALRTAVSGGRLSEEHVRRAVLRLDQASAWAEIRPPVAEPTLDDVLWARRMADAAVHAQRGKSFPLASPVDVIIVDDDPPRTEPAGSTLVQTLAQLGHDAHATPEPSPDTRATVIVALIGDRRIGLGFETFSDGARGRVREVVARAERAARDAVVVHFTPPAFGAALEGVANVVCAWSGTRAMEEAAARWLARGGTALPPVR